MRGSLRVTEELRRRPFFQDLTLLEEADAVGDVTREAHLVRGDDHGHARLGQPTDDIEHLRHQLGVQRRRDLVEQQQVRLHGQCPHDGHALLLAPGESVGILVGLLGEPEALQQREGDRSRASALHLLEDLCVVPA